MVTGDPMCERCGQFYQSCTCKFGAIDPFDTRGAYDEGRARRQKFYETIEKARAGVTKTRNAMPVSFDDLVAYLTAYLGDPVFAKRFADCIELIKGKNSDYTQGQGKRDRIAHFREAAKDLELPMLKIWQVFVRKHWATIQKYANGGTLESEPIDGRINDVINYMVLLGAIIEDLENRGGGQTKD